jgi:hypothetical protein
MNNIQPQQETKQKPGGEDTKQAEPELDADDEAAEILAPYSNRRRTTSPPLQNVSDGQQGRQSSKQSDNHQEPQVALQNASPPKTATHRGTKRTLEEVSNLAGDSDSLFPAPKKVKYAAKEDDIRKVAHDAAAWKEPSFLQSRARKVQSQVPGAKMGYRQSTSPYQYVSSDTLELNIIVHSGSDNMLEYRQKLAGSNPIQSDPGLNPPITVRADEREAQEHAALSASKLGDWHPHKHVQKESACMTWGKYRDILLAVGRARGSM